VRFKNGRRKAPLWAGLELRGARVGLSRLPIGFVRPRHLQIGAPPLQHLISFRSAECCERGRCVPAIVGVRVALAHDELRIVQNNSERQSTSGRSTDCGTGHLIRAFHDIGRMFSLLFPLSHPSPVGHQPRRRVKTGRRNMVSSKAKTVSFVFRGELRVAACRSLKREPAGTAPSHGRHVTAIIGNHAAHVRQSLLKPARSRKIEPRPMRAPWRRFQNRIEFWL
jgi:hypothetical protein